MRKRMMPAAAETCFAVVADVERWPEWYERIRDMEVMQRDDRGNGGSPPPAGHPARSAEPRERAGRVGRTLTPSARRLALGGAELVFRER